MKGVRDKLTRYRWFQFCLVGVALLLLGRVVIGGIFANVGMLKLTDAVMRAESIAPGAYPLRDAIRDDPSGVDAIKWLKLSVEIDSSSPFFWGLGRAGLAAGDYSTAAAGMQQAVARGQILPPAEEDVVLALGLNGNYRDLTAFYERTMPELRSAVFSDTVALAYLAQARPLIETGQESAALTLLTQAVRLRPTDLYANFYLYQTAAARHDTATALAARQQLMDFRGSSLSPIDKRLASFVVEVVPHLYQTGIWDQGTLQRVVAYLVWQQTDAPGLETLLTGLTRQEPAEPSYWFYLGELYQRQEKWLSAENAYLQTLAVDANYASAKWRLGLVCEKQPKNCSTSQALAQFSQYLTERPGDMLVLTKIASLCAMPGVSQANSDCRQFARHASAFSANDAVTDLQAVVASALEVPVESITFGADLIENGNFNASSNGQLPGWVISDEIARNVLFRNNAFVGGQDSLDALNDGGSAVRLLGLRSNSGNMPERSFDWYGIWAWNERSRRIKDIPITPGQWYLYGVDYRTNGPTDVAYMRLNDNVQSQLPATNEEWRRYLGLFCGSPSNFVGPFIFLSTSNNEVMIDNVSIRPVVTSSPIRLPCDAVPLVIR